jgi:hypothetical protein
VRFPSRKVVAGAAVAAAATAALVPAAFAAAASSPSTGTSSAGGATLAAIQARAASAISARDTALTAAITAVTSNKYLTSSDRATVLATLNHDLSGLNALRPVIRADTTVAKARTDYDSIFASYRVFALALPQARLAAACDDLTGTLLPRLTDARTKLQSLLSGADQSKDTPAVQATRSDLAKQISGLSTGTSSVVAQLLAYTPAQWNANHVLLAPTRAVLVAARGDARQSRSDIATIVKALK